MKISYCDNAMIDNKNVITERVGTNSGMDYWNGALDWTTELSYIPFWTTF